MAANWSVGAGSTIAESRPYSTNVPEPSSGLMGLALIVGAAMRRFGRGRTTREYAARTEKIRENSARERKEK